MLLKRFTAVLVLTVLLPLGAARADDDQPGEPIIPTALTSCTFDPNLTHPETPGYVDPTALVRDFGDRDQWDATQRRLAILVKALQNCQGSDGKPVDLLDKHAVFTFLIYYKDQAHRVIYQGTFHPDYRGKRLVGTSLYDIHLFFNQTSEPAITSVFSGTPVQNPLVNGIAKLFSTAVGAFAKSTLMGLPHFGVPLPVELSSVKAYIVPVPKALRRALITIQDSRTDPDPTKEEPNRTKATLLFNNKYLFAPSTKADVGLGAACILDTSIHQPVKVDSGTKTLVDDTPTTLMTYIAFNLRPWGFDESLAKPGWAEGGRIVIGPTLTPNPGITVGLGLSPFWWPAFRQFSVTAGYSVILANVLRTEDTIGKGPTLTDRSTRRGPLGVVFVGIGYALN